MDNTHEHEVGGSPMICATSALKTGPVRIGHIAGNVTLPRTVALPTAIAVVVGAVLGLFLAALVPVGGTQKWIFGPAFCGMGGWFLTTFSPLHDESLLTWFGLQLNTMRRQRLVDGEPVLVAVGSGIVGREVLGKMTLIRSAVRVAGGQWDERGVQITSSNNNRPLLDGAALAGGFAAPSVDLQVPSALQNGPGRRRATPDSRQSLSKAAADSPAGAPAPARLAPVEAFGTTLIGSPAGQTAAVRRPGTPPARGERPFPEPVPALGPIPVAVEGEQ